MLEIVGIIDEVSMTVDIVALNASIESAHAGAFGKGFSVIAKEIRKLSDTTKKYSNEISSSLKNVVNDIQQTASASNESLTSFRELKQYIEEVFESLIEITRKMVDLRDRSKEILNLINDSRSVIGNSGTASE